MINQLNVCFVASCEKLYFLIKLPTEQWFSRCVPVHTNVHRSCFTVDTNVNRSYFTVHKKICEVKNIN